MSSVLLVSVVVVLLVRNYVWFGVVAYGLIVVIIEWLLRWVVVCCSISSVLEVVFWSWLGCEQLFDY